MYTGILSVEVRPFAEPVVLTQIGQPSLAYLRGAAPFPKVVHLPIELADDEQANPGPMRRSKSAAPLYSHTIALSSQRRSNCHDFAGTVQLRQRTLQHD